MSNTFMSALETENNYKYTENGAVALKSTLNKVQDMFAFAGAYRSRSDDDCILLFKEAFEQDNTLALRCLFWNRDCRGGAGERRFFRVCFNWFCKNHPSIAKKNLWAVVELGRWDDLIYTTENTPVWAAAVQMVKDQLRKDLTSFTPSLLAKWLPSCNASSKDTKRVANKLRNALKLSAKEYRQTLSALRKKINIVERLMSANDWDAIEFSKLPSKAGMNYSNTFKTREETKDRYAEFINSKTTKVNAGTLFPYEVVNKALRTRGEDETGRAMVGKYWDNLPNVFENKDYSLLCVCDTSGSMIGYDAAAPINVAIGLSMYCAERLHGPFYGKYISFASQPQLIDCMKGVDFYDRVRRIYETNLCDNTNLPAVFDLLLSIADRPDVKESDLPDAICVISDQEIDSATTNWHRYGIHDEWTEETVGTEMQKIRRKWAMHGHKMPKLIYWNVDARSNTILDAGDDVTFVSGASQSIFTAITTGKSGIEVMLDVLNSERYNGIFA